MQRYYLALLCSLLTACATYQPMPLAKEFSTQEYPTHLIANFKSLPFEENRTQPFQSAERLSMTDVAIIAVLNNPDLKIGRDDAGIVQAQAFAAGLLPDPQLALSGDLSNSAGPGSTRAFSYGLSFDISTLITRSSTISAAQAEVRKTDLNLLWQEWQVVSQAQLLYVKLVQGQKSKEILQHNQALFSDRYERTNMALRRGLLTSDMVTPNLTAFQDVQKQVNDLERQTNQYRHDLNSLLGLKPETIIFLQDSVSLPALDEKLILAALDKITERRPDLMALEAGYQAQDQRYRAAIIAQFPSLNLGLTRARDSSGIYSNGVGLTLSLPLLNRNRGVIAIEKATRQKLHDEYQQRLNVTNNDIHKILDDQQINERQLRQVKVGVEQLLVAANNSEIALQHKNIDSLSYASVYAALLAKQIEEINLQQNILEQRVALQTLIGGDLPFTTSLKSKRP